MSEPNYVQLLRSDDAKFLLSNHPNAFIILTYIAIHARRYNDHPDGLIIGDALIGHESLNGLSRQNFRTGMEKLVELGLIKIVSNGKRFFGREKSTIKVTIKCHLVNLVKSTIYDINSDIGNQQSNQQLTNSQPTGNHKQERRRKKKNEKESHHPNPSSKIVALADDGPDRLTDDFSSKKELTIPIASDLKSEVYTRQHNINYRTDNQAVTPKIEIIPNLFLTQKDLDACLAIKGNLENVKKSIESIQNNPKRKYEITDWPATLASWAIPNKAKLNIKKNLDYANNLIKSFSEFENGRSWRCALELDNIKDQQCLLFLPQNPHLLAEKVSITDPDFAKKCYKVLVDKKMMVKTGS